MTVVDAVAAVMFAAVILYAVFGGADFGSGVWDLTAGNARRGAPTRRLIDHAIGPVWEANHVWLIFVLVFLWTGFPSAFAAIMRTLAIPFWLAGLGIVARGAAFAFRKYSPTLRWAQVTGVIFATASLVTPFFLGTIAGGIASGRVPANGISISISNSNGETAVGTGQLVDAWLNPTSLLAGVLATATCTYLAGVLLTADAERLGYHDLVAELRRKSLIGGAITGLIVLAGIPILLTDSPTLADGLLGRAMPLAIGSGLAGLLTMIELYRGNHRRARIVAAVAVALVVAGWGAAQYPWVLVDQVTVDEAAGANATLIGLLVASGLAAVLVLPPLIYLLTLADSNRVGTDPQGKN